MENYTISYEGYSAIVDTFEPITPEKAQEKIDAGEKEIIFIGKPSCPYCQKFAPKLKKVVDKHDLTVHYIFSEDPQHGEAIKNLRDRHQIKTVPALIYTDNTPAIKCDSSMTVEEIEAFVGK